MHGPGYAEPPHDVIDGHKEYEAEAILHHKKVRGGQLRLLVQWKDYPPLENSWQSEEDLSNLKQLLHAYKHRIGLTNNEALSDSDDDKSINEEEETDDAPQVVCLSQSQFHLASVSSTDSSSLSLYSPIEPTERLLSLSADDLY